MYIGFPLVQSRTPLPLQVSRLWKRGLVNRLSELGLTVMTKLGRIATPAQEPRSFIVADDFEEISVMDEFLVDLQKVVATTGLTENEG